MLYHVKNQKLSTMNEKTRKSQDNIDLELTRIYFGGVSREAPVKERTAEGTPVRSAPAGQAPAAGQADIVPRKRSFPGTLILLPLMAFILAGVVFAGIRFLAQKKIVFRIDIRDIVTPKKPVYRYYDVNGLVKSADLTGGRTLYDFERNEDSWGVPSWAADKPDHVALSSQAVRGIASNGNGSLEVLAEFPGGNWTGALVEIPHYLNLDKYGIISADIFLPPGAPEGLRAKLILTVGENWRFVEMNRGVPLVPGEWTTVIGNISDGSTDWKRTEVDSSFREDVRKIAIRVESNRKPAYKGPFYIDNVTVYDTQELSDKR